MNKQRTLIAAVALAMSATAVASAFGAPADLRIFAEGSVALTDAIDRKRERMVEVNQFCNDITNTVAAEGRDMTGDERRDFDSYEAEFRALEEDVGRMEANIARNEQLNGLQSRQAAADATNVADEADAAAQAAAAAARVQNQTRAQVHASANRARASVPAQPRDNRVAGNWGFASAGQYLNAVLTASRQGGNVDPRLIQNAPTTYGREGVGEDGGFAVPPDFRSQIISKVTGEESLLARTDGLTTSSNSITIPIDETTPWQSSGGIQAYWEREGGQKQQSKPSLGEVTIKAHKIITLVPMTDELLQDAPAMAAYVNRKAPEKINYKVSEAILRGTGVGQPLGILNSPGTIVVTPEGGQTADTVTYANVSSMFYRMNAESRKRGVWIVNGDVEEQLARIVFPGQGTGPAVPVFLPPGGISGQPYSTLFGRPIISHEAMPALGDKGDIVFADFQSYMTLVKGGGIKQDVSIHLFFDYDITAFRFVLRVGGQPWWNSPIERANGASRGFFITLDARA